jgi:tRNA-specific 2-thiouridylase
MGLNKNRVLVGMSGGVDSSVAAALLQRHGFEVVGITITSIKLDDNCKPDTRETGCCNYQAILDARDVCEQLGIEHHLVDLSDIFKEKIISNFIDEYMSGRTPNPCTLCNPLIKWGEVLKRADKFDCFYYATGHYSIINIDEDTGRFCISKGRDGLKDQSYFLWGLSQEQLERTIFPLGELTKPETRKLAQEFNIPVYNKVDSQEICFVPSDNYQEFLTQNVAGIDEKYKGGALVLDGIKIGTHNGYPFYTIGQRKGLGVSYHRPLYVKEIISETNTVVLATENEIQHNHLVAEKLNMMKYDRFVPMKVFNAKIRYRDKGEMCFCNTDGAGNLHVQFLHPRKAITPGQSVVIYDGDDVIAGGVIKEAYYED